VENLRLQLKIEGLKAELNGARRLFASRLNQVSSAAALPALRQVACAAAGSEQHHAYVVTAQMKDVVQAEKLRARIVKNKAARQARRDVRKDQKNAEKIPNPQITVSQPNAMQGSTSHHDDSSSSDSDYTDSEPSDSDVSASTNSDSTPNMSDDAESDRDELDVGEHAPPVNMTRVQIAIVPATNGFAKIVAIPSSEALADASASSAGADTLNNLEQPSLSMFEPIDEFGSTATMEGDNWLGLELDDFYEGIRRGQKGDFHPRFRFLIAHLRANKICSARKLEPLLRCLCLWMGIPFRPAWFPSHALEKLAPICIREFFILDRAHMAEFLLNSTGVVINHDGATHAEHKIGGVGTAVGSDGERRKFVICETDVPNSTADAVSNVLTNELLVASVVAKTLADEFRTRLKDLVLDAEITFDHSSHVADPYLLPALEVPLRRSTAINIDFDSNILIPRNRLGLSLLASCMWQRGRCRCPSRHPY
jgi:hypothetical protein